MSDLLRVRIHLNLKEPGRAESSVMALSARGNWVTVAYAQKIILDNVTPVVHQAAQQAIARGEGKKTPHAFLEGDMVHFSGRLRPATPPELAATVAPYFQHAAEHTPLGAEKLLQSFNAAADIGYNPRFAGSFYMNAARKEDITDKFVSAPRVLVHGWSFRALAARTAPLTADDRCTPDMLERVTAFEKASLNKGRKTTQTILKSTLGTNRP